MISRSQFWSRAGSHARVSGGVGAASALHYDLLMIVPAIVFHA